MIANLTKINSGKNEWNFAVETGRDVFSYGRDSERVYDRKSAFNMLEQFCLTFIGIDQPTILWRRDINKPYIFLFVDESDAIRFQLHAKLIAKLIGEV